MTTRYVFVGNPGVGKSTMLNSLVGAPKFQSGFNAGAGLTKALQQEQIGTDIFMDTPGLADTELAPLAAGAITEAFKLGGRFKVFFVFTLEAGRVRPEDEYHGANLESCPRDWEHLRFDPQQSLPKGRFEYPRETGDGQNLGGFVCWGAAHGLRQLQSQGQEICARCM